MHRYSSFSSRPSSSWIGRLKIIGVFTIVLIAIGLIGFWQFYQAAWGSKPSNDAPIISVTIAPGDRFTSVTNNLEVQGVASSFWLRVYTKLFDDPSVFPGSYKIAVGSNYADILASLRGVNQNVVRVTIPEGFSLEQMGERVRSSIPSISIADWNKATTGLEGYLFPDTYEFKIDASAAHVVAVMKTTMEKHLADLGAPTGDAAGMTTKQILTLASIVEKEVRTPESMKAVAAVFLKRLAIRMALQSDATINYVIKGKDPSPTYEDLKVDSLYNTYKYPGLPPGPIAAPSLNALTAVIHPIRNDYYFFLTDDVGGIYFGETYEEHLRNKSRYL